MAFKLKINTGSSSEKMDDTFHNIVIKFDSASIKRIQELTLDEAREKYIRLLKDLTIPSSGRSR